MSANTTRKTLNEMTARWLEAHRAFLHKRQE